MVFTFLFEISDLWRHLAIFFNIFKIKPNVPFIHVTWIDWINLKGILGKTPSVLRSLESPAQAHCLQYNGQFFSCFLPLGKLIIFFADFLKMLYSILNVTMSLRNSMNHPSSKSCKSKEDLLSCFRKKKKIIVLWETSWFIASLTISTKWLKRRTFVFFSLVIE